MPAARYTFRVEQGATLRRVLTLRNEDQTVRDLTGHIGRMHVRPFMESPLIQLELTTENGRMTIDGPAGRVTVEVSADDTAALDPVVSLYDLEIESASGFVTRLLRGSFIVSPEVTREEETAGP